MTSLSLQTHNSTIVSPPASFSPVVVSPFESQDAERWDRYGFHDRNRTLLERR
jgi:hypothetical protein